MGNWQLAAWQILVWTKTFRACHWRFALWILNYAWRISCIEFYELLDTYRF